MRIDSCRTCGGNLQEFQHCDDCRKTTKFICKVCNKISDEQIHPGCHISEAIA